MEKSLNIKKRFSVRAKSVGMKLLSEMPLTPKGMAKVDVASNEGGSVSSNTQEPEGASAPNAKVSAFGGALANKLLS